MDGSGFNYHRLASAVICMQKVYIDSGSDAEESDMEESDIESINEYDDSFI